MHKIDINVCYNKVIITNEQGNHEAHSWYGKQTQFGHLLPVCGKYSQHL